MWLPAEGRFEALEPYVTKSALHTSDNRDERLRYIEGTRGVILTEIETWAQDLSSPPILCLTGPVGAGKSVIASQLASRVWRRAHLAGEFFFWRGDAARSGLRTFATTLAYHLGFILPSAATVIRTALDDDRSILQASPDEQWEFLIIKPLETLSEKPLPFRPLFIIDGIDECPSRNDQIWVLTKMIDLCQRFPVALMLSSRPEYHLKVHIATYQQQFPSLFRSFIELGFDATVQEQMRVILYPMACSLSGVKADPNWVPSSPLEDIFEIFISNSCGQFIIMQALQVYMRRDDVWPSLEVLKQLQDNEKKQAAAFSNLDKRYDVIMSSAESHLTDEQKILRNKIFYYLLYMQLDSILAISIFWDASSAEVRSVLDQYHSVLRIPVSDTQPLSFDTYSFRGFLSSPYRGGKDAKHHISKLSFSIDAFERSIYLAEHRGFHMTANAPTHLFALWLKLKPEIDRSSFLATWRSKRRILLLLNNFNFSEWVSGWYLSHASDDLDESYENFREWLRTVSKGTLMKFDGDALSRRELGPLAGSRQGFVVRLLRVLIPKWMSIIAI